MLNFLKIIGQEYSWLIGAYFAGTLILNDILNFRVRTTSLLLNNSVKVLKRSFSEVEKTDTLFNEWLEARKLLSSTYSMSSSELKNIDVKSLLSKINSIEKELSKKSTLTDNVYNESSIDINEIKNALAPDEAAIEIIRFRSDVEKTSSIKYAVLIIKRNLEFPFVKIFEDGYKLENKYLRIYNRSIKHKINDKYSYEKYWGNFNSELEGIKKIYLTCDGVYNQINIETLQYENNKHLIDRFNIIRVTNIGDILSSSSPPEIKSETSVKTATLIGNPNFPVLHSNKISSITNTGLRDYSILLQNLNPLPGTDIEINKIEEILVNQNYLVKKLTKENANKENLYSLRSPNILHIATHGFFISENSSSLLLNMNNKRSKFQNPFLQSGLILSYDSNTENQVTQSIFTSFDVIGLNLGNTDLVVLSACETGLGEIMIGEGVYGLQRAFQMAGAKSIIMSLWKIDDGVTQKFMTSLYEEWAKNGDLEDAIYMSKLKIKKIYNAPYYWGAFVLANTKI